jgi:hypothetical protein
MAAPQTPHPELPLQVSKPKHVPMALLFEHVLLIPTVPEWQSQLPLMG